MTHVDDRPWHADPWDDPALGDDDTTEVERSAVPRSWRRVVLVAAFVAMASVVAIGVVGLWYTGQVNPAGDPGDPITFTVNDDDTVQTVSERLEAVGLVERAWVFRYYVEHHGGLVLIPGYYRLRPFDHMGNLMRALSTPPSQTYTKVTFPEGFTYEKMAARLAEKVPRLSPALFGAAATDGSVTSTFLPEGQQSLEGLLFPDTYQVSNGESERQVVQRMVTLFERVAGQVGLADATATTGLSPYEVIIVASIIEREAKVPEDRAKIAKVIYNRLALGMPLQVDATLYYQQDDSRPFSELKELDTPYNTYLYTGLPPTPIASPGRASLEAALHPAADPSQGDPICTSLPKGTPCRYLYYVIADTDGRHAFAATIEQHEENVRIAREKGLL